MSGSNAVIAERGIMPPFLYRCPNAGGNIQAWMADNAEHDDLTYVRLTCLHDRAAVLCAFDLIELNSKDLRKQPIEARKHALANLLYRVRDGIVFNRHYGGDGAIIYRQACALGCEGIVSKRVVAMSIPANGSLAARDSSAISWRVHRQDLGRSCAAAPRGPRACAPRP